VAVRTASASHSLLRSAAHRSVTALATRGHVVSEDRLTQTSAGVFVVTNQRIVLQPAPGNKPVSIPLNTVLSYNCYNNEVKVYKEDLEKEGYGKYLKLFARKSE
jgi:hypothetical protein